MEVTVKAFLKRGEDSIEVRRIGVSADSDGTMFKTMYNKVTAVFPGINGQAINITWEDPDGDFVLMTSDEEFQDALAQCSTGVLKVFVSVRDEKEVDQMVTEETCSPDTKPQVKCGMDDKESPMTSCIPFDVRFPPTPIVCPPPPPECWEMPPPPPPPFHRGRCGNGFRGGPGGCMRGKGHHRGPHHDQGRRHGPPAGPWGPMFGWAHHGQHSSQKQDGEEKHSWKKSLRESVPVTHRRWTKIYVHNWRNQNIKNTTTSSSDSDIDKKKKTMTTEEAGVPEAYVVWLDMVLNKFHQKWEVAACTGLEENFLEKDNDECMATLKMSVPVEYQKWLWWFLVKRYGKRSAPIVKGCHTNGTTRKERCGNNAWNAGNKMHKMAAQVPRQYRRWAKQFIMTWRLEHQIPTTKPKCLSDTDEELSAQDAGVPEDYSKWLLKFLPRWHMQRGQINKTQGELPKGGMCQFKDTVPMEFRAWVRCYMNKQYNTSDVTNGPCESNENQYNRWLQIFKKKWLQQHGTDCVALCDTSSDEDTGEMRSSFKRLRLDQATPEGNAPFNDTPEGLGTDDSDVERPYRMKFLHPGFKRVAKAQLYNWEDSAPSDGDNVNEELPPHVYRWLSHLMVKMQKKKMKQELKSAKQEMRTQKRELKAAAKAQKYNNIY